MLQSCGIFEASLRSERREMNAAIPCKSPTSDKENKVFGKSRSPKNGGKDGRLTTLGGLSKRKHYSSLPKLEKQQYHAAVKLQKVYKSFRTRRQLADCAVVVEQRWWKLLDFAELKRSSISFFDIEKPETALSRWSRARTRAAKVGKGLSKDAKARKLALQHWLEAIDPRHRYGHNLQFYYVKWLHCQSKQPFFYWLDIGDGREVNFDRCSRLKLLQQCIKYLGPTERKAYEVVVNHRKLVYKQSGKFLDTTEGPKDAKWIFVLSTSKSLYVGQKKKGTFQHSSFLAGGATLSAGRLVVDDGVLKAVWPHSGHYLPTEENFQEFKSFLKEHDVDLANVKESPAEDEEEVINKKSNVDAILDNRSNADLPPHNKVTDIESLNQESIDSIDSRPRDSNVAPNADDTQTSSNLSGELCSKITRLKIPSGDEVFDIFQTEEVPRHNSCHIEPPDSPSDEDYESAEDPFLTEKDFMFAKINLFDKDEEEEEEEEKIPKEKILKRIDSHKGMKSYQLAKQLSSKWTTGVGPRIGFMRDYPSELQFQVLEQANLSPRSRAPSSTPRFTSRYNAKVSKSTSFCK